MQSQTPQVVFQIIHTYLLKIDIYFGPGDLLYVSVPRQTDLYARKLHLGPKTTDFFLFCVFWAFAKATSEAVSFAKMESSGGHDVWQSFVHIRVE